ncbi:unnamed protein product [Dovyalis caffra]|uniref:DNA-directed RNA polymerase V subunit 1-like n=1 Tax=Dovyalis caffra TaxID=77055 RepID=A0AAV1RM94_9ROSI|nr:unnamed protein product [Dovyalis caffra]
MVAKGVLKEHLILLGNSMTCAGNLIGFYTGGYKTLSRSLDIQVPFTEATLFTPRKIFEKAAEKCHTDSLSSIVASCSWGKHVTVGTGSHFDVLWDTREASLNPEGGIDAYSFLNMVRSTAGGEDSVTACLGAEVDDLILEDEDWNLSPEHNSSSDKPTFEDSAEFQDFLDNQPAKSNWEKASSLKDGSRSAGNWDVDKNDGAGKEKPWSFGMSTAETNDVVSNGWDTAATRKTNSSWNLENDVTQSNSWSGWATKKPETHNGFVTEVQEEPAKSNDWDADTAWGRKAGDNKFANETNASKSWWGKVTDGDESGQNKNEQRTEVQEVGTLGWDDKMSQGQSISGWASTSTQEATTESFSRKSASVWGKENTNVDEHGSENHVLLNQGKESSDWDSKDNSKQADAASGWKAASSCGAKSTDADKCWGNKVTSNQADTASGWGKPPSPDRGWGVSNSGGGNGSERENNTENQSLLDQGKDSGGWGNKATSNQPDTACGWGKPESPEISQGWGSSKDSVRAVDGWGVPNSAGGNGSERDQQWGQQGGEFKKNRSEGSRGWGSNNGDWKKRNRPTKPHEDSSSSGLFTATRQRLDIFTSQEQDILSDVEPLMLSIRRIMHQTGHNDGDPLSADDQSYVLDNVFNYHPDKAVKMGAGIDYVTNVARRLSIADSRTCDKAFSKNVVKFGSVFPYQFVDDGREMVRCLVGFETTLERVNRHSSFQDSRCFYIVSTDGCKQDFSYRKCLENFIRGKYPDLADEFIAKYFARRGNRQRTPAPDGTEEEKQAA